MPKEMQSTLPDKEKKELLMILEHQGRNKWLERWKDHMAFPENLNPVSRERNDQERVLRYLLFRVLINQQARFEKVRQICKEISTRFADILVFEPCAISEVELFDVFREVAGQKGSLLYKVGALGGVKPISLFAYRYKAYEGFVRWLEAKKGLLLDLIVSELQRGGAIHLFQFFNTHPVLEAGWVGNDPKACRMFVNWAVFLFNEIWEQKISRMPETLMIVDGHVGKVFCRTGLLGEVVYEKARPYIIQASKMRQAIEELVCTFGAVPFYVDNGAFYLFEDKWCEELDPRCPQCPISDLCKKYTKWTAYRTGKD